MDSEFFKRILAGTAVAEESSYLIQTRHWGSAITLDANTRVNSIEGEPSLHFHRHRTEEYILYSGLMTVYRGEYFDGDLKRTVASLVGTELRPGDKVVIHPNVVHIPINKASEGSVFIEVSHGPYEDSDIVRVYDKTGRDAALSAAWTTLGVNPGIGVEDLIRSLNTR